MAERQSSGRTAPQKKTTKKKGKRKFTLRNTLIVLFFTGALVVLCGIIGYFIITLNGEKILNANKDQFNFAESSVVYDRDGNQILKLFTDENRENVEYSQIPKLLADAFVAVEDRRFREHSGLDFISIGRAVVKDIVARSAVEGGSTITQQLAKNMFLSHDKTILRKATEASIALALDRNFTKDQILEMYLNRIFFGQRASGIKAAAELYFGKEDLNDLEVWEIATLAGIPKAPSAFNPLSNPEKSKERRAVVLQLMYEQGLITKSQMDEAKAVDYDPDKAKRPNNTVFMAFVDYAIDEAMRVTNKTEEELRLGGYEIHTTLNVKAQTIMEDEFKNDDNFEKSGDEQKVQGAMIVADHRNGEIEAMVGGRDYAKNGWNRVVVPRQPGSSFKPITSYGPALQSGNWFPWSTLRDDKECFNGYCPSDSNRNKYIGPVSMSQAIKESRNLPAVWLLNQIGVGTGLEFAKNLGFNLSSEDRNLAIALGGLTHGVTPMEMTQAYSVFANGGKSVDLHTITLIKDKNGLTEYEYKAPKSKQLMSPEAAWYMTQILQGVTEQGGTGARAKVSGRPVAGKTGTTQHGIPGLKSAANRDVWFVGYTPEWTAAVWMGYDKTDKDHLLKKSSGQTVDFFTKVMNAAMKDMPKSSFKKPSGVKETKPPTGVNGFNAVYIQERGDVQLSWTAVEGSNVSYRIYRKEASEPDFKRILDQVDAIAAEDISIEQGKSYEYYVTAYDANTKLESASSAKVKVDIPIEEIQLPDDVLNPGDPNAPGNGQPEDGGNGQVPPDGTGQPDSGNPEGGQGETPGGSPGGEAPNGNDGESAPGWLDNGNSGNRNGNGNGQENNARGNKPGRGNNRPDAGNPHESSSTSIVPPQE
ncbi:PBP1A family penicillin-binding protein [Paenibacillus sp. GCM10012307]|nr:PBP1A family penicillin-binding protein [Paenibacillus roseus]